MPLPFFGDSYLIAIQGNLAQLQRAVDPTKLWDELTLAKLSTSASAKSLGPPLRLQKVYNLRSPT